MAAEDADSGDSLGTDYVPTGRRRSTYAPPPADAHYEAEPGSALGGPPAVPTFSPELHEGDQLDSDEQDEGDTEALGFSPPPRRSLDDSELVDEIKRVDTGTIEQITMLQQELRLREADARDFQSWERAMLALGTPEALSAVEQARPTFTGVVPIIPTASGSTPIIPPTSGSTPIIPPASGSTPIATPPSEPAHSAPKARHATGPISEPGIDLPAPDDATIDAVLMDERDAARAPEVRLTEDFVVVGGDMHDEPHEHTHEAESTPPPLVLPPEPETDLDRVLRARWQALDTPVVLPRDDDGPHTGEGPVSTPGSSILVADVVGLSDQRLLSVDTGGIATYTPPPPELLEPRTTGSIPVSPTTDTGSRKAVPHDHRVLQQPPVFSLERSGIEPTPVEQRNGRALRLFWLWFGANGSAISVALGAVLLASGMSLRQGIVASLVGVGLSFLPLGLGTLAGKRSGMPTMVVSRATFGLVGNVLPAAVAVLARLFWGAAFLWLFATSASGILADLLPQSVDRAVVFLIALGLGLLLAAAIAIIGFRLFERIQLVLTIVSAVLIASFVVLTAPRVDLAGALTVQDGPWVLVVGGAVLVFSTVGLLWAQSSSDLARYQRVQSSSGRSMLWSSFGVTLPTFVLIAWGCLLAASDPALADGLVTAPFATLASILPSWFPLPLLLAVLLPLLSALAVSLYSGGLAMQAAGLGVARDVGITAAAVAVLGLALLLSFAVPDITVLLRDAVTTLAVPVAAWTGIFCAEMMIRHRQFDAKSLLTRGGIYADVRWPNLISFVVTTLIGFGLTSATLSWLDWQGYLFRLIGMSPDSALAQGDPGVLVALGLGLLTPLLFGVGAVRSQEGGRQ
jgi:purine-cytosine permease-like protein